ncbi:MAG: TerB family tellurite resistance protein [Bacteroidales bacterium]|nr:TerB family tellurite resistance protein [Bacteroidales bacterium]
MLSIIGQIIIFYALYRLLGLLFSSSKSTPDNNRGGGYYGGDAETAFRHALLKVMAAAMKADGRVVRAELNVVKRVLVNQFGEEEAREALLELRDLLRANFDPRADAMRIGKMISYADRLRIADILCQIAEADGIITDSEVQTIVNLAYYMGLTSADTMRFAERLHVNGGGYGNNRNYGGQSSAGSSGSVAAAYKTLGISPDATNAEVKDAYRSLAKKYHPDRYATQSAEAQAEAEQKFKEVQAAYEAIKEARGV